MAPRAGAAVASCLAAVSAAPYTGAAAANCLTAVFRGSCTSGAVPNCVAVVSAKGSEYKCPLCSSLQHGPVLLRAELVLAVRLQLLLKGLLEARCPDTGTATNLAEALVCFYAGLWNQVLACSCAGTLLKSTRKEPHS